MRPIRFSAVLLGLALATPATAQQPEALPSVDLPAELERVLRDYERAWEAGDASALAELFTEDGFVPSRHGWRRGSAAIREQYANAGGRLRLRVHAWAVDGAVGWIVGAYGYGAGPGGKFVLALRRGADGRWLIAADLDGPNRPEGGGGEAPEAVRSYINR